MQSDRESKLRKINELVNILQNDLDVYNQFILPIQQVQSELRKNNENNNERHDQLIIKLKELLSIAKFT